MLTLEIFNVGFCFIDLDFQAKYAVQVLMQDRFTRLTGLGYSVSKLLEWSKLGCITNVYVVRFLQVRHFCLQRLGCKIYRVLRPSLF